MAIERVAIAESSARLEPDLRQVKARLDEHRIGWVELPSVASELRQAHPQLQHLARQAALGALSIDMVAGVAEGWGFEDTLAHLKTTDALLIPNTAPKGVRGPIENRITLGAVLQAQLQTGPIFATGGEPRSFQPARLGYDLRLLTPTYLRGDYALIRGRT